MDAGGTDVVVVDQLARLASAADMRVLIANIAQLRLDLIRFVAPIEHVLVRIVLLLSWHLLRAACLIRISRLIDRVAQRVSVRGR